MNNKCGTECNSKNRTLVFLKPDVFEKNIVGQVIADFEKAGVKIIGAKKLTLSKKDAERFYAVHKDQKFFPELIQYATRGPILPMVLEVDNAVVFVRNLMGATNPTQADKSSLRGKYGESFDANVLHGSDSPENAENEIAFFFSKQELTD